MLHVNGTALIRYVIEITFRIWNIVVDGRARHLTLEHQHARHGFDRARRDRRVTDLRFDRAHRNLVGPGTEHLLDRSRFHTIVQGRRRTMGIDIIDILGRQTRGPHRLFDRFDDRSRIFATIGQTISIARAAIARDHREDLRPALFSFFAGFQHEGRSAFTTYEARPIFRKRTARLLGRNFVGCQRAEHIEIEIVARLAAGVDAADEDAIPTTTLYALVTDADRLISRRAGAVENDQIFTAHAV